MNIRHQAVSSIFEILAEQRILDAIQRGELDNLPGAGKPLEFDDDPFVSPEQRMMNRILKNAGISPREVILRKEIANLRKELEALPAGDKRKALKDRLVFLLIQISEQG